MTEEMFGEYVQLDDDFYSVEPQTPVVPEGELILYIDRFEQKFGATKPSFGYNFILKPYSDIYDIPVESQVADKELKKYFYVGKANKETGKLYERAQGNRFQTFLISIGIGRASDGLNSLSQENVRGVLVRANIVHEKVVSNQPHPQTGQVPDEIDENDPYTYTTFAVIGDNIRGVRDEKGNIKRVNV